VHMQMLPDMDVRVPEGDHRVVIRGANIEPFMYDVSVERGQTTAINFNGLQLRAGALLVNIADEYAVLTVDGVTHPANEPISLEFGTHTVVVAREGFETYTREVEVDSELVEISVALTEIIRTRNIMLLTAPPGARVYLDGDFMGTSPVAVTMEYRRYTLNLALAGYVGVGMDVWITEETDNVLLFPMVPDSGGF